MDHGPAVGHGGIFSRPQSYFEQTMAVQLPEYKLLYICVLYWKVALFDYVILSMLQDLADYNVFMRQ